jgi:hypothetical protein
MKKIGSFMSPRWGHVDVIRASYGGPNGPVAIVLTSPDDPAPIATLSVNMYRPECSQDSRDLPPDCFYVKQWGGQEEVAADALASGLFIERPDLPVAESGYVTAPAWQLVGA